MSSQFEEHLLHAKRDDMNGAPKLWILIEHQTICGSSKIPNKSYEVIDVKDVCGPGGGGNAQFEMTTGKLIHVRRNAGIVRATIVTISDDKNFLDTELNDLIELQKSEQNHQNHQNPKKRKRMAHVKTETHTNDSPSSYHSWYGCDTSNATQSSVIISNPNVPNHPPMTFDQQTQTDFKPNPNEYVPMESRLAKILINEDNIMRSQQANAQENQEIKQQMHDLGAQIYEVKSMLTEMLDKIQGLVNDKAEKRSNNDVHSTNSVLNFARNSTPNASAQAPRILNLSNQLSAPHQPQQTYYSTVAIEPIEASNDSSFSISNNSRRSLSASNHSIYHNDINQSMSSLNSSEQAIDLKRESRRMNRSFVEEEGNDDDEIVIGNNQTTVPRNVLMDINWKSHTAATRKLLRAKFSRETLATHSLTGKPSPGKHRKYVIISFYFNFLIWNPSFYGHPIAFMDSSKPTKNQLDPSIIADIVQYVSKKCNVSDTAVRSSITTKCADENKMLRQRNDKDNKRKALVKIENNKENI